MDTSSNGSESGITMETLEETPITNEHLQNHGGENQVPIPIHNALMDQTLGAQIQVTDHGFSLYTVPLIPHGLVGAPNMLLIHNILSHHLQHKVTLDGVARKLHNEGIDKDAQIAHLRNKLASVMQEETDLRSQISANFALKDRLSEELKQNLHMMNQRKGH